MTVADIKVDIVIPTYNRSGQLREAIESVRAQTVSQYNLFVLDNCSTDDTRAVVAEYEASGVSYIRNPSNLGMVGNWNRALDVGSSPYLLLLHDDDALAPDFLETVLPIISGSDSFSFLHTAATIINGAGERQFDRIQGLPAEMTGDAFFARFLQGKMSVICPSVIYNRSVIPRGYRFQEELPFTADVFMFIGASEFGPVLYCDKPVFRYREHEGSTTSSMVQVIDRKIGDRKHASAFLQAQADRRDIPAQLRQGAGRSYRLSALTADVWFTRLLGGSYGDVFTVARKIVAADPGLMRFPKFYQRILLAMIPSPILSTLAQVKRRFAATRRA